VKTFFLLILCGLLLAGCVTVQVETTTKPLNGEAPVSCRASYSRFWFDMEGFKVKVCGGDASIAKTTNNTEMIDSLLPLLLKGAALAPK